MPGPGLLISTGPFAESEIAVLRVRLDGFDVRMPLGPAPFVAAGLLALGIAIPTTGAHAWRVARTTPIKALRYE